MGSYWMGLLAIRCELLTLVVVVAQLAQAGETEICWGTVVAVVDTATANTAGTAADTVVAVGAVGAVGVVGAVGSFGVAVDVVGSFLGTGW